MHPEQAVYPMLLALILHRRYMQLPVLPICRVHLTAKIHVFSKISNNHLTFPADML